MTTTTSYSKLNELLSNADDAAQYLRIQNRMLENDGIEVSINEIELNATYVHQGIDEDRKIVAGIRSDEMSSDWSVDGFYGSVEESTYLSVY
ncbi:hypothetical protein NVP1193O_246 [Vibrio phage 1.193.O._10N.286.52.C6]|nr:hypothetical protein NVP1193O_246 [Vibrio phage 1.193.O._10N.286.52.C6]